MSSFKHLKYLCRLCAKSDEFCKDLLEESNKNVMNMIRDFIQITISESDDLPTRICLNCEEKMVSFQLFVLECYKVQEDFRKQLDKEQLDICTDLQIKLEDTTLDYGASLIKSEVKDELTAEDIVCAITSNDASLSEFEAVDYNDDIDINDDVDEDDDDLDDVAIASLKEIKQKRIKKKVISEEDSMKFSELLKQPNLKVKDFVQLICHLCGAESNTWSNLRVHYFNNHRSKVVAYCLCGYAIRSKSVLYKHFSQHKLESRKIRSAENLCEERPEKSQYSDLKINNFVNFNCKACDKVCSSWYSLKSHCERAHKILPVVHCVCGIALKSKSVLYKHINDHKNPNVLSCDKCPRITKTMAALNKHKMRHVPKSERKFTCESCDKIFNTKDALKSHERSHIPIEDRKIYHCGICNMKFTTRSSAASHKRVVHDKIKSYVCDLCGYACGTNGELRQHRAIHSDDKPFVCRKCSKPFKTYSNLKTHMDIHEETSYPCYVCSRVLNSRRTLRKHLLVHEDKCRHVCSYCNKAFKRRQTLKVHMYTHTGDKPLTCKWCDERFAYASTLRSHRLRCHPDKMAAQMNEQYVYRHVNILQQMNEQYVYRHVNILQQVRHLCVVCCWPRRSYASTLGSHRLRCHPDKMAAQMNEQYVYRHVNILQQMNEQYVYRHVNILQQVRHVRSYASTLRSHRLRCHPDKMAAQMNEQYVYRHVNILQQDYIKADIAAINAKNEVEAI
ncbi:zinc finger protein 718-like [Cydia fagiglandana]|uniref:zinc finger protein 718-like n=1 Tax=Cydia fagiglandana TaxID=1458189 RepID=UPI002FEDFBB2